MADQLYNMKELINTCQQLEGMAGQEQLLYLVELLYERDQVTFDHLFIAINDYAKTKGVSM